MHYVTDLHLHSKYSRAVSPKMTLPVMAEVARVKGLDILSAADFTHPVWYKEIREQLVEDEEGLFKVKSERGEVKGEKKVRFLLSTEISSIYKQDDKLRRIHNLIFVPGFETAEKFNKALISRGGNLNADGRPIVGLSSKALLELLLSIDDRSFLIPCHIWTPHFGVYGSASGFDSLADAYGDLAQYIYGIETGLSSDPDMNWQVRELMNRTILSFSDAHSAPKMGREATVMELEAPSFMNIKKAIMRLSVLGSQLSDTSQSVSQLTGQPKTDRPASENRKQRTDNRIIYTLEFYPEEGKYHFSGHRNCKVVQGPEEIRASGNICPACHRRMTEGVLYRVQELADEKLLHRAIAKRGDDGVLWYTDTMGIQPPYVKLIPLLEIAAASLGSTVNSQKSQNLFTKLCTELGSELNVLLKSSIADIEKVGGGSVAEGITRVREGNIFIDPGYDGLYGKVEIWKPGEVKAPVVPQLALGLD